MAEIEAFEQFFKPEARSSGADFVRKGAVRLGMSSDTEIQAFIKVSSGIKVTFTAEDIADEKFFADCSCPAAGKGILCKHIWATLMEVSEKFSDFLDSKIEIEKGSRAGSKGAAPAEAKAALKEKQSSFRKEQYQKQKARAKEPKEGSRPTFQAAPKKTSRHAPAAPSYPDDVAAALRYFDDNGFPLGEPIDPELLRDAKKKLARLMHPDSGGTHEEFLVFNSQLEVIVEFIQP